MNATTVANDDKPKGYEPDHSWGDQFIKAWDNTTPGRKTWVARWIMTWDELSAVEKTRVKTARGGKWTPSGVRAIQQRLAG